MENNTVKVYTYRYMYKCVDGSLKCAYITGSNEEHVKFMQTLNDSNDVKSALREYQGEIDYAFIGFTEPVKVEKKKEENQSEV